MTNIKWVSFVVVEGKISSGNDTYGVVNMTFSTPCIFEVDPQGLRLAPTTHISGCFNGITQQELGP